MTESESVALPLGDTTLYRLPCVNGRTAANIAEPCIVGVDKLGFVIVTFGIGANVNVGCVLMCRQTRAAFRTKHRFGSISLFSAISAFFHLILFLLLTYLTEYIIPCFFFYVKALNQKKSRKIKNVLNIKIFLFKLLILPLLYGKL